jgi:hypothetical protein
MEVIKMKKLIKRMGAFMIIALFMVTIHVSNVSAADNSLGPIIWDKGYSGEYGGSPAVYTMNLSESGKVSITLTYEDDRYAQLIKICDKSGNELADARGDSLICNISADLLAGEYEVVMYNTRGNTGPYSFVASFESANETVSEKNTSMNNEIANASSYTIGKNRKAQLAVNDNTDIYKVKVKSNCFLKLTVNSELSSMDITTVNNMGDVSYSESSVTMGKHTYTYFCPKGTYYITVKSSDTGVYSFKATTSAIPSTSLKKVTNVKTKSVKLTWTRKSNVNGYQIQYSTDKNFKKSKKTVNIDDFKTSSTKLSKLTKSKTYYVRIRTYVKDANGKKYYSAWSTVKKVKIGK